MVILSNMKTKTKKATKKTVKDVYTATVLVMGKKYSAKGDSAFNAIAGLVPGNAKGRSIIVIEKGDYRKERILMPMATMRLFNTRGITREVAIKQMSNIL